jgi:hypothetical protein
MNEIAVVTAVAGDYDHIGSHVYNDNVDYLFFSDGTSLPKDPQWLVLSLYSEETNIPRKLAKYPKLNPHYFDILREYRYIIWIDGSMQIKSHNFVPEILSYLNNGLVLSPHFDGRDCGYGEATIRPPKYADEPLDEQCDFYHSEGFPEHYGLWECGVEARDMTVPLVAEFGRVWMEQVLNWSTQDQVSCGYALWKTGLVPDVLDKSWREYDWLHINAHKREI